MLTFDKAQLGRIANVGAQLAERAALLRSEGHSPDRIQREVEAMFANAQQQLASILDKTIVDQFIAEAREAYDRRLAELGRMPDRGGQA